MHPTAVPHAPAYVVVPAMGMRASFYRPLLAALARTGVHAGVVELRGHQRRPAAPPSRQHDHGYAELVADLGVAVDTVRQRWSPSRVLTLGHSLGGQVATAHAALAGRPAGPAAADAVTLVASGSVAWRAWGRRAPWHLLRTQALLALTTAVGHFPGHRVGFAGREAPTQMTEWARWGRTGRLAIDTPPVVVDPLVAAVHVPVLAVSFARDRYAPASTTDALAALYPPGSVTRLHLDPGHRQPHSDWVRAPEAVLPHLVHWARAEH